jgi:hypothetical protein
MCGVARRGIYRTPNGLEALIAVAQGFEKKKKD